MSAATSALGLAVRVLLFAVAAWWAYDIRLIAIKEFGRLIHEFDPWFNYHATRYLFTHGAKKFFTWFDHTAWYPIGRPVGTTIYPGMQFTSVAIWHLLNRYLGIKMSLNDICVFVPAWFGAIASVLTGFLAAEASGVASAGPAAALVMSIIPAHIMRSMGGGYDNESIAVTAMVAVFWLWCRSVRTPGSWPIAVLAGLAHVYMVAAWGGYVFVINMVGAHAGLLWLVGRYNSSVHKAYTFFFLVGIFGAMQVPVVGLTPLKSLEQVGPLAIFAFFQVLAFIDWLCHRANLAAGSPEAIKLRNKVFMAVGAAGVVVFSILLQAGAFIAVSARVRGLFLHHTRTGNPLVDSVAEHQPTTQDAYWRYLHYACLMMPLGLIACFFKITNGKIFLIQYAVLAYFFASKMNRLIILMGPIASVLSGVWIGVAVDWGIRQSALLLHWNSSGGAPAAAAAVAKQNGAAAAAAAAEAEAKKGGKKGEKAKKGRNVPAVGLTDNLKMITDDLTAMYQSPQGRLGRLVGALLLLLLIPMYGLPFYSYCQMFGLWSSSPSLVFKSRDNSGKTIKVTDYLDSYYWLAKNTPEDARVLAWWDYGYQISGIANRTSLADGNTWNHEHIALIARCLTSPEKRAHELVRHLADYVLVWAGGRGDDLDKSPHIARIGNSVYHDICGDDDPLCYGFGFYDHKARDPTPPMANSLLYKLVMNGLRPGVHVDDTLFKEVHTTQYGMVRIYKVLNVDQESRAWLADTSNYMCDRPGSWYCPGQYPPKLPERIGKGHKSVDYNKHMRGREVGY